LDIYDRRVRRFCPPYTSVAMADLKSPVLKRSSNVPGFEQWIIRKNFLARCSGSKQVKHVPDPNA